MKGIAILGSTGSIGKNALEVILEQNQKQKNYFCLKALAIHSRIDLLEEQIHRFRPSKAVIYHYESYQKFLARHSTHLFHTSDPASENHVPGSSTKILYGSEGLLEVLQEEEIDLVLNAFVGFAGLEPSLAVLKAGKDLALANKESLVVAGSTLMKEARAQKVRILPVDSEHSAIFFLLQGRKKRPCSKTHSDCFRRPFFRQKTLGTLEGHGVRSTQASNMEHGS